MQLTLVKLSYALISCHVLLYTSKYICGAQFLQFLQIAIDLKIKARKILKVSFRGVANNKRSTKICKKFKITNLQKLYASKI